MSDIIDNDTFDAEWELGSGLPLDGARVVITAGDFGYRTFAPEAVQYNITFTPVDGKGDANEQSFSCGKGWEPGGKGATLEATDDRPRKINDQTGYGKWIAAAVKLPGVREALIAKGTTARVASTWVGMEFTLGTIKAITKNPVTNIEKETTKIVPVAFWGVTGGDAVASKPAAAGKASSKAAAVTIDPELEAKLLELAAASPDHDTFMAQAFDVDGVAGTDAENAVMASGKGSIWARGQA